MVRRKVGTVFTTISILWEDKDEFRKFAKFIKKTKNGDVFESDHILFKRMLESFKRSEQPSERPNNTYPRKANPSQVHDQQG